MGDEQANRYFQYLISKVGDNHRVYGNIESEHLPLPVGDGWLLEGGDKYELETKKKRRHSG